MTKPLKHTEWEIAFSPHISLITSRILEPSQNGGATIFFEITVLI